MKKMICPQCKATGKKSTVRSLGRSTTLIGGYNPYWDEEGEYHSHDMNTISEQFSCSEGHMWGEKYHYECPNPKCDWGKE